MEEAGASDFAEHSARISGQALGQLGAAIAVELALGIEKVGTIENPAHHVPLGEADGVVPDGIEHAPVDLALCLGMGGTGGAMPELPGTGTGGCPLGELLR
jgi:hypothetical protein